MQRPSKRAETLHALWDHLTMVKSEDGDVERRGRTLAALVLILATGILLAVPVIYFTSGPRTAIISGAAVLAAAFPLVLNRRGMVNLAAWIIVSLPTLATLVFFFTNHNFIAAIFILLFSPVIGGVVLRAYEVWLVVLINVAVVIAAIVLIPVNLQDDPALVVELRNGMITLGVIGVVGSIGAAYTRTTMRAAHTARMEAERAVAALQESSALLEQRVAERTAELAATLETQQLQAQQLQAALESQRQLNNLILQMSLPIIPVRDDVLVAPLVGTIDSARAERLLNQVLDQVARQHARTIIIDVTGVPLIDVQVARAILHTAHAVRLLGCETILTGVRPEVAQTMVSLGIEQADLRTAATLQQGLALAERAGAPRDNNQVRRDVSAQTWT